MNLVQVKPEHKIWLQTVFNTTNYLVANGLPFRGLDEKTDFSETILGGLYLNIFGDLLFIQDPSFQKIAMYLPKNATRSVNIAQP